MSRGGMRGGRGMIKGFGPPGYGRGRGKDGAMNGYAPMRYWTNHWWWYYAKILLVLFASLAINCLSIPEEWGGCDLTQT